MKKSDGKKMMLWDKIGFLLRLGNQTIRHFESRGADYENRKKETVQRRQTCLQNRSAGLFCTEA